MKTQLDGTLCLGLVWLLVGSVGIALARRQRSEPDGNWWSFWRGSWRWEMGWAFIFFGLGVLVTVVALIP